MSIARNVILKYAMVTYHTTQAIGNDDDEDMVYVHSIQLLSMGLMYIHFRDAIKEGDGEHVLRSWKYMLPIFVATGRKNCAKEALLFIAHQELVPGRLSQQMQWSRFVNTRGGTGHNIPADLHNEHLNKVCKNSVKALGSNKTKKGITRTGKALGTITPILKMFDNINNVPMSSGNHSSASTNKDRDTIISDLLKYELFQPHTGRGLQGILKPKSLLKFGSQKKLIEWIEVNTKNFFDM